MKTIYTHWLSKARGLARNRYVLIAAAVVVLGAWVVFGGGSDKDIETIVMAPQEFKERVSATGKVIPAQDVELGFSQGGRVSRVYVKVGDRVSQGAILAEVENADLRADVMESQALLAQQEAKLASLKAGAKTADIAASEAALSLEKQELDNLYQSISDSAQDAYTKAEDAVRNQLNGFFSNPDSISPQLTFNTSNSQAGTDAPNRRVAAGAALDSWQSEISGSLSSPEALTSLLGKSLGHLSTVRDFLASASKALDGATNLSATTLSTYKANIGTAQAAVNTATKNLNTISQSIAAQKLSVAQAQAQLDLKKSGASAEDIQVQEAAVAQARAGVGSAQARLAKTLITAPFSGTVTEVDAKAGMTVGANTPQVSLDSAGTFQIESYIPEVNIAQIALGDSADVALDAYGADVPFSAAVVSIDPAETVRNGISTYRVLLQFSQADSRIKSGMTASLTITTDEAQGALVVPVGAIFTKNGKDMLRVRRGSQIEEIEVVVGAKGVGEAQILAGLMEGDEVVLNP